MPRLKEYFTGIADFINKHRTVFYVAALLIACGISSYAAYVYFLSNQHPLNVPKQNKPIEIPKTETQKEVITCPLDGETLNELPARRMLAVSIDNAPAARPQSGLKEADIVVEMPVEGGMTRLLAFYYHGSTGRVGPIRSARPYLAAKALEYGAVLVHVGQSPQATQYFAQTNAEHIDEMPDTPGFWREPTRKSPHNLYTSTANLWDYLQKSGKNGLKKLVGFNFLKDAKLFNGVDSQKVTIFYPYGEVSYVFQPIERDYLRFISDKAHIDAESFLPLRMKNIIIQFVNTKVLDGEGRLQVDLEGKGRAVIAYGGKVIEGSWTKIPGSVTKYFDQNGHEIELPPGQTWIEIVQNRMEIDY